MATTCPACYNTSCPEPAEITLTQVTMEGPTITHRVENNFSGTVVTLTATPYSGFPTQVFVNGVLQRLTTDYTIENDDEVTFTSSLTSAEVTVIYIPVA